jgi:hypothetical protein
VLPKTIKNPYDIPEAELRLRISGAREFITIKYMAEISGISRREIRQIEAGKPTYRKVGKMRRRALAKVCMDAQMGRVRATPKRVPIHGSYREVIHSEATRPLPPVYGVSISSAGLKVNKGNTSSPQTMPSFRELFAGKHVNPLPVFVKRG